MIMTARTASGKELALVAFYQQLKRDGIPTVTELARRARVGRAALERVLNGQLRGRQTWKHVLPILSAEALCQLKQCSAWNNEAEAELLRMKLQSSAPVRVCGFEIQQMWMSPGKLWIRSPIGEGMEIEEGALRKKLELLWLENF